MTSTGKYSPWAVACRKPWRAQGQGVPGGSHGPGVTRDAIDTFLEALYNSLTHLGKGGLGWGLIHCDSPYGF